MSTVTNLLDGPLRTTNRLPWEREPMPWNGTDSLGGLVMAGNSGSPASTLSLPPAPKRVAGALAAVGAGLGIAMLGLVIGFVLAGIRGDYFSNTKEVRDTAVSGSDVLAQLGQFSAAGAWLTPFHLRGRCGVLPRDHDRAKRDPQDDPRPWWGTVRVGHGVEDTELNRKSTTARLGEISHGDRSKRIDTKCCDK